MPRRKPLNSPITPKINPAKRARVVPIYIVERPSSGISAHVVNLKKEKINPLLSVEPIRTPKAPINLGGFAPDLDAFRRQAGAIAVAASLASDPAYAIQQKPASAPTTPVLGSTTKEQEVVALPETILEFAKEKKAIEASQKWYHSLARTYRVVKVMRREVAIGFAVMSLLFTMPIYALTTYPDLNDKKDTVLDKSNSAVQALQQTKELLQQGDIIGGGSLLISALTSFEQAQAEIDSIGTISKKLISYVPVVGKKLKSGERLLKAGEGMTLFATQMLYAKKDAPTDTPTNILNYWHGVLTTLYPKLASVENDLNEIEIKSLPQEIQPKVEQVRMIVRSFRTDLARFLQTTPSIIEALGGKSLKRYLIVFENSSELRATGGFIGSFALLDVDQGRVKNLEIAKGGSYDLQGQLDTHTEPPRPLYLVNNRWEFQDANWFPDFPTSARNLLWFYEHSGGPTVDGVIAINDQFVTRLLRVVGDIRIGSGTTITADNFIAITATRVAQERTAHSKTPKAILAELGPLLLRRLTDSDLRTKLHVAAATNDALLSREIMMYSTDEVLEDTFTQFGWDGGLKQTNGDYLHVNISNIGGGKSDTDLTGRIEHQAWIQPDGSVINTVNIIRTHDGATSEASNISYVRLYVPKGSEIIEAAGFTFPAESDFHAPRTYTKKHPNLQAVEKEIGYHQASGTRISEEFGKTAFGNWVITRPHQTSVARVTYRLPFAVFDEHKTQTMLTAAAKKLNLFNPAFHYSLFVERQAGLRNMTLQSHVVVPPSWRTMWYTPLQKTKMYSDGAKYEEPFTKNVFFGVAAEEK